MNTKAHGFTLIELMIAVAVIGLLAAIAIPSYQNSLRRAARADLKSIMMESAGILERNYTRNGCYHRNDADCGNAATNVVVPFAASPRSGAAKYNIAFTVLTAQTYTLTATPTGSQTGDACGNYTLDHTGQRGVSGGLGVAECWQH
ncbi:MAG: type IV pilin protein [Pseudomonadota bacterium]